MRSVLWERKDKSFIIIPTVQVLPFNLGIPQPFRFLVVLWVYIYVQVE